MRPVQASSVPPTPVEGILPMKKRENSGNENGAAAALVRVPHSDVPTGVVTVDFVDKKLKDKAMMHLVQACKKNKRVVFLVCANHKAGDNFEQSVPFWFDGMASLNEGPPMQLQFVQNRSSHVEAVTDDGSDFYHNEPHLFYSFRFDEHVTGMVFRCHVELTPEPASKGVKKRKTKDGKQNASPVETVALPPTPVEFVVAAPAAAAAAAPTPNASKKKPREKPLPQPPGSSRKKKRLATTAAAPTAEEEASDDGAKEVALEAVDRLERHVQELLAEVASVRRKIRNIKK